MMRLLICVSLLVNLLFVGVQCKPIDDSEEETEKPITDAKEEAKTAGQNNKTLEHGNTYEKLPVIYSLSGSGSGEVGPVTSPPKIFCPPDFLEMWMKVFKNYPDQCMKNATSDGDGDNDRENNPNDTDDKGTDSDDKDSDGSDSDDTDSDAKGSDDKDSTNNGSDSDKEGN